MTRTLRVGTRGSTLALRQTALVVAALGSACPELAFETVVVTTRGDERRDVPITSLGDGAFVKALEAALRLGTVDLAVHSAKDVPVDGEAADLPLAAFPPRADPRDVLIARDGRRLATLRPHALLATGSPRRAAQLLARRPDLEVVGVRGNVDTRIRKLLAGQFDALVLAAAGLERLGRLAEATDLLDLDLVTPAAGQGALAVQCRADDGDALAACARLDHAATRQAVLAERAVLRRLGGGCKVPVGAHARLEDGRLHLRGVLAALDGSRLVCEESSGDPEDAELIGTRVGERLALLGAGALAGQLRG